MLPSDEVATQEFGAAGNALLPTKNSLAITQGAHHTELPNQWQRFIYEAMGRR
jgi:hypothetical protein